MKREGSASARLRLTAIGLVPPGPSGVLDHGRLLAQALRLRGHEVAEVWQDNEGSGFGRAVFASARILHAAWRLPAGSTLLVHYSPVAFGYRGIPGPAVGAGALARFRGCRTVVVLHELAYTYQPHVDDWRRRITSVAHAVSLRIVLWGADAVVVTTEPRRRRVQGIWRRCRGSVHLIPVFSTVPVPSLETRPPHEAPFTVGVPGYSGDGVRPDLLIDALVLLQRLGPIDVALIGGPGRESRDGQAWLRLAERAGVGERLRFSGVLEPPDLSAFISSCDLLILVNEEGPSARKTSLATALAHGRPIVSLDGPNRWEELVHSGAVVVVPPSPEALARAMNELRDDPERQAELGARARAYYDRAMTLDMVAERFEEVMSCCTSAGSRTSGADACELRSSQPSTNQGNGATR